MQRRVLLSLCAVAPLAGCVGQDGSPDARLAWIWLQNDREESFTVDVVVEEGGETVFSSTYELGADLDTANRTVDAPVEGPGAYIVRATLDGETREVDTTDFVDGKADCIGVRFSLLNNGSVDYWTKAMQECTDPDEAPS